jgi:hypothetical protein
VKSNARAALQSFRCCCSTRGVTTPEPSSRSQPPVQSFCSAEVRPLLLRSPRCAVGRSLGYAVFPQRTLLVTVKFARQILSSGLASHSSITQQSLAGRPQSASSSLGLLVPSALAGSKVHLPRALPTRYVPSSGFGYPLDGFLPSNPRRFCFTPAALLGFTLRSISLSQGTEVLPLG